MANEELERLARELGAAHLKRLAAYAQRAEAYVLKDTADRAVDKAAGHINRCEEHYDNVSTALREAALRFANE